MVIRLQLPVQYRLIFPIIRELKVYNATCYLVGGAVRDAVLDLPIKDIDIEVHGIKGSDLQIILEKHAEVIVVGKQFGVFKLTGIPVDWSLPRADSWGRKPIVTIDQHLSIEESCRRRDVTMNAMALNMTILIDELCNGHAVQAQVIDPFGGINDLKAHILRVVDKDLFIQDPLRFYRVMQFIARFSLQPDEQLNQLCKEMALSDTVTGNALAKERVHEELKKMLLKSTIPSLGFRWLLSIGRLHDTFPELYDTVGVEQRPDFHPEGDVFEHTMQALDAVASMDSLIEKGRALRSDSMLAHQKVPLHFNQLLEKYNKMSCDDEKYLIMLTVICHDFGKVATTEKVSDVIIRSWNHEKASVPLSERFLRRFMDDHTVISAVKKLVLFHMHPSQLLHNNAPLSAYKRLALSLYPHATLWHLSMIYCADLCGRNESSKTPLSSPQSLKGYGYEEFIVQADKAGVLTLPEEPLLTGTDLLTYIQPGPLIGKLLDQAYMLQIRHAITDKHYLEDLVINATKKSGPEFKPARSS